MYPTMAALMALHFPFLIMAIKLMGTWYVWLFASQASISTTALFLMTHISLRFSNIRDINISISNYPAVNRENCRPPLVLDCKLTSENLHVTPITHCNYAQGDYFLLYNTLVVSDLLGVLKENSSGSAIHKLASIMTQAMNLAIIPTLVFFLIRLN